MPRPPAQFRINSKSIFLTYPQCHLSKEECLQQIINLQYPIKPVYIRVCQEEHQDGTPHLHCLIQFEGRFQTRNQRFFDLLEWAADNIRPEGTRPSRPRSLILEGPSRTGKTCWARSLGPHNYYMGHLDMTRHNDDAWYNVIDDVDPQYLKHWKEFIGANKGWQSNCKYAKPKLIKGGIPCIVLCNDGPKASYKEFLDKDDNASLKRWTLRNADFYFISEPLFADGDADDATEREASARHSEEEQETEEVPS